MGGTDKSPAKDMKTGKYEHSFESPAKQKSQDYRGTEGQDQDKIFDKNGKHIGNYVNGKAVYHADNTKDAKKVKPAKSMLNKKIS